MVKTLKPKEIRLLKEYDNNFKEYKKFSQFISAEIKKLLKKHNVFYQIIQKRVKNKKSLIPKLSNANKLEEWKSEENSNMKKFLREYKKYLNNDFIFHQKAEDSEYNLRRLEFDVNYKS